MVNVSIEVYQTFRKQMPFIAFCFQQFYVTGKLSGLQQLTNALYCTLPGNDLGSGLISGSLSMSKMDTVLSKPGAHPAFFGGNAVAAVI